MCIFGGEQSKPGAFTPADPKVPDPVSDLPQASDLKQDLSAELKLGSDANKKKPDQEIQPVTSGTAALAINPQPTGINV